MNKVILNNINNLLNMTLRGLICLIVCSQVKAGITRLAALEALHFFRAILHRLKGSLPLQSFSVDRSWTAPPF